MHRIGVGQPGNCPLREMDAMESFAGKLLIASPYLGDRNFNKSVVLIIQHGEDGAFGLVLNRPTNYGVADVWDIVSESDSDSESCQADAVIHHGGPVEGPLMALHTKRSYSEHRIAAGVYFAASKDKIRQLLAGNSQPVRIFSGYSGWGSDQLESELEEGAWLTHPASRKFVFVDDTADLWKIVAKQVAKDVVMQKLDIKNVPSDPSLN